MNITEKLTALRRLMRREHLAAYIISGTDPHNSEYLPATWRQREWISGFTGSFGTVVVTLDDAGLWTDTRYFIQAERQLRDTGIALHKLRVPGAVDYPAWLATVLPPDSVVGIDSFCMPVADVRALQQALSPIRATVREQVDLLGELWIDRPPHPPDPRTPAELAENFSWEKVPRRERERIPVLADGRGVAAVAGFGPDQGRTAQPGQSAYEILFWKKDDKGRG